MGKNFFSIYLIVFLIIFPFLCSGAGETEPLSQPVTVTADDRQAPADETQPQKQPQTQPQPQVQNGVQPVTIARNQAFTKIDQFMEAGEKLFQKRDYANSIRYFYAVTKAEPKNIKAWKKVAFCYYQLKKHNYAYSAFQMVLKFDKADKDALEFMEYYRTIIDKSKKSKEKREMFDSLWRSAALPGFGQFNNNQGAKGIILGSAFLVSIGLTAYNVSDERMKYDKYLKANENQDIAYKEAQDSYTGALIWGIVAGVVYIYNIIDAGMNYNCEDAINTSLELKQNTIYLASNIRW